MRKRIKESLNLFNLNEKMMKDVKAGNDCCCACAYEGSGGSSTGDNCEANYDGGLFSPECYPV